MPQICADFFFKLILIIRFYYPNRNGYLTHELKLIH